MKKSVVLSLLFLLLSTVAARADYLILHDGRSYSGTFSAAQSRTLSFQDGSGIQYTFPLSAVQSVVFSNDADHISLHNGQSYSGKLQGVTNITFMGVNGIKYVFAVTDISSIIFTGGTGATAAQQTTAQQVTQNGVVPPASAGMQTNTALPASVPSVPGSGTTSVATALVIPSGTQISVRTGVPIDTTKDAVGQLYSGTIQQSIADSTGAVAIPAGTSAKLQVLDLSQNQSNQSKSGSSRDLALGLYSVTVNGNEYRVDSSSVRENSKAGFGLNKRTAVYTGGGTALGALLGTVFGGGKGAAIGTLAGGGMGALTQYLTRGKDVKLPAESILTFRLEQTLVLHQ